MNNKGMAMALMCILFPVILGFVGICIDGGRLMLEDMKINDAVRHAAQSAVTYYDIDEEAKAVTINRARAEAAARNILETNCKDSEVTNISISDEVCELEAQKEVRMFFINLVTKVDKKTVKAKYTANLAVDIDEEVVEEE